MLPWLYAMRLGHYVFVEYELPGGCTLSPEVLEALKSLWEKYNPRGYEAVCSPTDGRIAVPPKGCNVGYRGIERGLEQWAGITRT